RRPCRMRVRVDFPGALAANGLLRLGYSGDPGRFSPNSPRARRRPAAARSAVEQRTAFSRAWEILDNHPGAVMTARLSAVAAGMLTAALLAVLALFVDLLISHGRTPAYDELGDYQRSAFLAAAGEFTGEPRDTALAAVGLTADLKRAANAPVERLPAA